MREIKFRAWNEKFREWEDPSELVVMGDGAILHYPGGDDIGGFYHTPVVMQFTGLKDKNGKEIYEGDVVKDNETLGEIVWMHGCLFAKMRDEHYTNYFLGDGFVEVIGNIYENSDLLK